MPGSPAIPSQSGALVTINSTSPTSQDLPVDHDIPGSPAIPSQSGALVTINSMSPTSQDLPVDHDMPGSPAIPSQSGALVTINSTSPTKDDNTWIRQYNLTLYDHQVIKTGEWLNDNIIYAAQCLLSEQRVKFLDGSLPNVPRGKSCLLQFLLTLHSFKFFT